VRLIDPHAHLNADRFADDVELVVGAARLAGVERMLIPGWNLASSARALELVERWPWLDASAGVHPHDAAKVDDAGWARIEAMARDERVVAIGETGLDSDRMFSPWDAQLENLRRNLALALATGKPAILHCRSRAGARDAQDALLDELRTAGFDQDPVAFDGRPPAIVHSFSGPLDYGRDAITMGLAISFSGLVFRRGEESSAAVVPLVPAGRLLVETDSPFLAPPGAPKGRMEPAHVGITARWLAEQRREDPEALGGHLVDAYDHTIPRSRPR
jgi:TatD DNase family protein